MSAWIVSRHHIDALVAAGRRVGVKWTGPEGDTRTIITDGDATAVGKMLWVENHRSVNARYGENTRTPRYEFRPREDSLVGVVKAAACYEYQSCEHPGWQTSEAARFIVALLDTLVPDTPTHQVPGYDDAPWGIDSAAPV